MVTEEASQNLDRLSALIRFYEALAQLEYQLGGKKKLRECHGRMPWPRRGVYFFFEDGERRSHSGVGLRVTRVGTHAVSVASKTTLWKRLAQHKGSMKSGGGNHRGSIFRSLVGEALLNRDERSDIVTWGDGQSAPKEIRIGEHVLEAEVTNYLGNMPFLWMDVEDEPAVMSLRGYIEMNSIALLSNFGKSASETLDAVSENWLGSYSGREQVIKSGLWNNRYVDKAYEPSFLQVLEQLVDNSCRG